MEYATRAGTLTTWYTGNSAETFSKAGWHRGNSADKEHRVGQKLPNAWGFHDTLGNVWQWVIGFGEKWAADPGGKHVVNDGGFDSPADKNGCRGANLMVQKIPSGVRLVMIPIEEESTEKE
jgi:formylglycine-generating enzyme required for sulfatase activity